MKQKKSLNFQKDEKKYLRFNYIFKDKSRFFNQIKLIFGLVLQGVSPSEFVS